MTKISILEQLKQADAEGYAIPHFNYSDIWDMTAIVRAAEEMHSPVTQIITSACLALAAEMAS